MPTDPDPALDNAPWLQALYDTGHAEPSLRMLGDVLDGCAAFLRAGDQATLSQLLAKVDPSRLHVLSINALLRAPFAHRAALPGWARLLANARAELARRDGVDVDMVLMGLRP